MCRLRGKLGKATDDRVSIDPVRGIGYRLRQAIPLES
jgi:DNA-binding response OmpR family regulator